MGVSTGDFYQMFAYAQRYRAPHVVVIYPKMYETHRLRFTLVNHAATISVATINLHRDLRRPQELRALARELNEILALEVSNGANIELA